MINAKFYKQSYANMRKEIIEAMQERLQDLPENSLDLSQTAATCNLQAIDDQESITAMGVTLDFKNRITVYGGVYDPCNHYDINDLWFETLLDLYECFEEALSDPEPYFNI